MTIIDNGIEKNVHILTLFGALYLAWTGNKTKWNGKGESVFSIIEREDISRISL